MNTKKMAASTLAIMMVAAIFVTTAAAFTAPNANDDRVEFEYSEGNCDGLYVNLRDNCTNTEGPDMPTLRIYGEGSYDAAFPYTDPEGPFDPTNDEAPCKDFVVFNPAYIGGHDYPDHGAIKVNTGISEADANEKIFVRQWYVPEYPEPRGDVWLAPEDYSIVTTPDIVTEYSYMLLKDVTNDPTYGYAGATHLWLPIGSEDIQIGLDSFEVIPGSGKMEIVAIKEISDFNGDGMKDINVGTVNPIHANISDRVEFLDHEVEVTNLYMGAGNLWKATLNIYYIGNDARTPASPVTLDLFLGDTAVVGRSAGVVNGAQSFNMPWQVKFEGIDVQTPPSFALLKLERRLHMNETFFVDGAEYDIPMIFGPEDNPGTDFTTFKYITIRNPLPKLDLVYLDGLSIWKQPIMNCTVLPMLPPFNMDHTMIDDINLPDCYTGCPDDEACDLISADNTSIMERDISVGPLEIMWYEEAIEPRFHTNLLEILKEPEEIWQWIHINIMPNQYTEMVYPPLPDATVCSKTLPGDFLLVSSWEAPNSCNDRMKFAYDANDSSDIYVNEQAECGNNSVRIYGEDGYGAAFPYTDPEGPFNKLSVDAPRKDFVTFNPAYIGGHDYPSHGAIKVNTGISEADANEKIFVRQWYVPEYPEPRGDVWLAPGDYSIVTTPDIVTEYSYMLLKDGTNDPTYGYAGATHLWLPIGSEDIQIGLDSFEVIPGSGKMEIVAIKEISDFNGDGMKDINVGTVNPIHANISDRVEFLDHEVEVTNLYMGAGNLWKATLDIYYIGNDARTPASPVTLDLFLGDTAVVGRSAGVVNGAQSFNMPWQVKFEGIDVQTPPSFALLKLERRLHMNETFFVDGAEYDIPMIFGPEDNPGTDFTTFKYITIRNPLPKYNEVYLEGLSIWKQPIINCTLLPMLPPFNMDPHKIVDDIGIPHHLHGLGDTIRDEPIGIDDCADTVVERIVTGEPAFVSYFVEETVEERFRTNLLEILDEDATESWDMLCMWTLPWAYTAMVYPDVGDMTNCGTIKDADFIVTTSGPKEAIVTPPTRLEGDVTDTGLPITGADAQLVAQHIVGTTTLTGEDAQAADVNDNHPTDPGVTPVITGADLQLIKQYVVGTITAFPAGVNGQCIP